jgi:hypothetical protein
MNLRAIASAAVIALGGSIATAAIAPVPANLQGLIDSGDKGITIGDKTFYDFTLGGSIAASQIQLIQAPGSDIGVEFRYNWTANNGNNEDSVINYKVHVNDPNQSIVAVGLHFDGTANLANASPFTAATVTETINDMNGNNLGQISVINNGPLFPATNRDSAVFNVTPTHDLSLQKDILVHSGVGDGGTATISLVDNTFQQSPGTQPMTAVPLPPAAWMALSTLGLGALVSGRRRIFGRLFA